jgi:pyruvate/2-oxoglutarate dehydrogenase complex dihydrolipoamide acyltransferase (E2) component
MPRCNWLRAPNVSGDSDRVYEVAMPSLSVGMEDGAIVEWLVHVGDSVRLDQPICLVETDKADIAVESPVAGLVQAILADAGKIVAVGDTIAKIYLADGA